MHCFRTTSNDTRGAAKGSRDRTMIKRRPHHIDLPVQHQVQDADHLSDYIGTLLHRPIRFDEALMFDEFTLQR